MLREYEVARLYRRRDVSYSEVVAVQVVNANGYSEHAGIVPRGSVRIQCRKQTGHGGPVCMNTHCTEPFKGLDGVRITP